MALLSSLLRRAHMPRQTIRRRSTKWSPQLDRLDDRISPTVSSISAGFNNRVINAGSTIWFNSVIRVNNLPNTPVTIHVTDVTVTSDQFQIDLPDSAVTYSPTATQASTSFDAATNTWTTEVPTSLHRDAFLAGGGFFVMQSLPGGINPVTWSANFTTTTPGITLKWQWAAAVYSTFSTDNNALGVKPVDGRLANPYHNRDDAGTPENFKQFVRRGARGQGGNNYTGNYTARATVMPEVLPIDTSCSLAGFLYVDDNSDGFFDPGEQPLSGRTVELTGIDETGMMVALQTQTDAAGYYQFVGLAPGTYALHVQPDPTYNGVPNAAPGSFGGDNGTGYDITGIQLGSGDNGTDYNFGFYSEFG